MSATVQRDRTFERRLTRELSAGLSINPEPLIVMAEQRANLFGYEYGHDFPSLERNLELETLEELCDAKNYIGWRLEAIHRGLCEDEDRTSHLQAALRYVALAFEEVRRAYEP